MGKTAQDLGPVHSGQICWIDRDRQVGKIRSDHGGPEVWFRFEQKRKLTRVDGNIHFIPLGRRQMRKRICLNEAVRYRVICATDKVLETAHWGLSTDLQAARTSRTFLPRFRSPRQRNFVPVS